MNFSGEITVKAPRERVFEALRDARFFASCVEGVQDLQEIDDAHYKALLETRVAYLRFKFDVAIEITRIEPFDTIEAKVEGVPMGIVGRMTGKSLATLDQVGEETAVKYEIDVSLTGKLGALGRPVLKSKAKEMERNFTANLRAAFKNAPDAASSEAAR